jgi:hypothetical protein
MQYPLVVSLLLSGAVASAQPTPLNALEQEFKDSLTGATMQGFASRDGKEGVTADKYNVVKVEKGTGDNWTFSVNISFRGQEMVVPVPLEVKWAGDTPVLTVTDKGYPGMGTYTARVVVYKGHYAGTWFGKSGGGKVYGEIVKKPSVPLTAGRWVGTVTYKDGLQVPFSLDMKPDGATVRAAFNNSDARAESALGNWDGQVLRLSFPTAGNQLLEAKFSNGALKGKLGEQVFEASPYCTCAYEGEAGPDISGAWKLDGSGLTLKLTRQGEDTLAAVQQDGGIAAGTHVGRFDGLMFALSYFDGTRASVLEIEPRKDGSLGVKTKRPGEKVQVHQASRL